MLESLASGYPLVSTRVGQAPEIVEDGVTALLVDVEDVEALAGSSLRVHDDEELRRSLAAAGRSAAEAYAYDRLDPRWAALLDGFVDLPEPPGA